MDAHGAGADVSEEGRSWTAGTGSHGCSTLANGERRGPAVGRRWLLLQVKSAGRAAGVWAGVPPGKVEAGPVH